MSRSRIALLTIGFVVIAQSPLAAPPRVALHEAAVNREAFTGNDAGAARPQASKSTIAWVPNSPEGPITADRETPWLLRFPHLNDPR